MFPMLGIVRQAGRCGAASEPRSGGARMVRQAHQPFPRFSACRNRSQGDSSPFIKNTILFPLGWSKDPGPSLARMFLAFFVKSILHLQARALQKPLRHSPCMVLRVRRLSPAEGVRGRRREIPALAGMTFGWSQGETSPLFVY